MMIRSRISLTLLTAAALAAGLAVPAASAGAAATGLVGHPSSHWVSTWAASPSPATPPSLTSSTDFSSAGFSDQTIRNVVWASAGGRSARIRLSNVFGTQPITFRQVDIGRSAGGGAVTGGTSHRVTFGGRAAVTIRPGTEVVSDPVALNVPAATDLAVSLFTATATGPATYHSDAQQVNYIAAGDQAANAASTPFTTTSQSWYFLDDVDVQATPATPAGPAAPAGVVAFGDSITDGYQSTVGANTRWPNDLARRFLAAGQNRAVADEGISGNRVLHDSACFGVNAQSRFFRDVAERSGARYVIMLEGINDIGFSQDPDSGCTAPNTDVSAAQIIAGYQHIIAAAHRAGLKIYGATLTPFEGAAYASPAGEAKREAVNQWIRTSHGFDGVIDFDQAVRDPAHPLQILPAYDSGDHLHPNDAGYQAMANAINLALFKG